jgi:hypothetical protein
MMAASSRHRESGVAASLTENGREGEVLFDGKFQEKRDQKLLPNSLPKSLPDTPKLCHFVRLVPS